jgi:hypothetical protein
MLNTAIVGLGWWGKTLVKAAHDFGAPLRFVRGITLEPDTVRDFAAERNIAIGTSFEDVLADTSIQAVVLATPHTKHRAQVEAIAAAGKHLYCEKPFALSKACRHRDRRRSPFPVDALDARFGRAEGGRCFRHNHARRRQLQSRLAGELPG